MMAFVFVAVEWFRCSVVFLLRFDVFSSFLMEPDLFALNGFMTIKQRYATVAFIYIILCPF